MINLGKLTHSRASALLGAVSESSDIAEAQSMYGNKTFREANKGSKTFATSLSTIAQVVSAVLASSYVYFKITLPSLPFEVAYLKEGVAVLLSLSILAILEILKKQIFTSLFISFFKSKSKVVSFKVWLIPIALLLTVISVYTSFEGAKLYVSQSDKSTTIASDYQSKISDLEKEESAFKKSITWKGKIDTYNRTNAKILAGFEDRKNGLYAEKNKEIGTHQIDIEGKGLSVAIFSLIMEVVAISCFGFICYVNFYTYVESKAGAETVPTDSEPISQVGYQMPQQGNHATGNVRKVGFSFGENISIDTDAMRINAMRKGNCKHCGNEFEKRTTWQKYCNESCRVAFWEAKTGKKFNKKKVRP